MTPLWSDVRRAAALCAAACAIGAAAAMFSARGVEAHAQPTASATPAPASTASAVSPRACAGCHAEVTREWQQSLHAQSFRDPIFQAEFQPHPAEDCVACHAPLATDRSAPAAPDTAEGVGCVSCHVDADGRILGASPGAHHARPNAAPHPTPPHTVHRSDELASAALCARCHEFAFPPPRAGQTGYDPGILQQATFGEWRASRAARQGLTCVSCHMPRSADGHFDHRMPGASAELLARALRVEVQATSDRQGVRVRVSLRTQHVGHALPTGDIFRRLIVRVERGGASTSTELRRYFGVSHVAGSLLTTEIDDTRVMPGRARVVTLRLPAMEGAETVRWSVAHARLDLDVARARGLPLSDVLTVFESGEATVR